MLEMRSDVLWEPFPGFIVIFFCGFRWEADAGLKLRLGKVGNVSQGAKHVFRHAERFLEVF